MEWEAEGKILAIACGEGSVFAGVVGGPGFERIVQMTNATDSKSSTKSVSVATTEATESEDDVAPKRVASLCFYKHGASYDLFVLRYERKLYR